MCTLSILRAKLIILFDFANVYVFFCTKIRTLIEHLIVTLHQ